MGNIVLRVFAILSYVVLCFVFCLSPHMGGIGKKFGIKVENSSRYVLNMVIIYTMLSILYAICFSVLCVIRNNFIFMNISILLYVLFMVILYMKIRHNLKIMFVNDIFGEYILNNPPENYMPKIINPLFYSVYVIPALVSFFIGRGDSYVVWILSVQIFILSLSFALNILICKLKSYVYNDDIENSLKRNLKYRKMWNVNMFFTLFALSASVTVMYAESKNIIYISGIGVWLPLIVIVVSVGVLLFYSFAHYKK